LLLQHGLVLTHTVAIVCSHRVVPAVRESLSVSSFPAPPQAVCMPRALASRLLIGCALAQPSRPKPPDEGSAAAAGRECCPPGGRAYANPRAVVSGPHIAARCGRREFEYYALSRTQFHPLRQVLSIIRRACRAVAMHLPPRPDLGELPPAYRRNTVLAAPQVPADICCSARQQTAVCGAACSRPAAADRSENPTRGGHGLDVRQPS